MRNGIGHADLKAAVSEQAGTDLVCSPHSAVLRRLQIGSWKMNFPARSYHGFSAETFEIYALAEQQEAIDPSIILQRIHPDDRELVLAAESKVRVDPGELFDVQYRLTIPGCEIRYVHAVATPKIDALGNVIGLEGMIQDITEGHEAEVEVRRLLYSDETTGLPNRCALRHRINSAIALEGWQTAKAALVLVELVGFDDINMTLGHANGDCLLIEAQSRIQTLLGPGDFLARTGNAQFAVLMSDIDGDEALRRARIIVSSFEAPIAVAGVLYELSVTVGIALAVKLQEVVAIG